MSQDIFTIGHSNHPIEVFLALLKAHGIEVLADIRSQPYSKYALQFNKAQLQAALATEGIKYLFLGDKLGGRPSGSAYYDAGGFVLYNLLARSPLFLVGIARLEKGIERYRVALMCSEEDPSECHRHLLVARVLRERGVAVNHIRGDGAIQRDEDLAKSEIARGQDHVQGNLFHQVSEDREWKSTRSVLPRNQPQSSSDY